MASSEIYVTPLKPRTELWECWVQSPHILVSSYFLNIHSLNIRYCLSGYVNGNIEAVIKDIENRKYVYKWRMGWGMGIGMAGGEWRALSSGDYNVHINTFSIYSSVL